MPSAENKAKHHNAAPMPVVYVIITMDCERAHPGKPYYPAGPQSWTQSRQNITAFSDYLLSQNIRPSFFAVPEACREHQDLFHALIDQGCEVGLHLHPRTFEYGINEYLGLLPRELQYDLIRRAKDAFQAALGFAPRAFRAGFYSADAHTFDILAQLGFTHTSTTIARRHHGDTGAAWANASPQPNIIGNLFEIPVTSHPTQNLPVLSYEFRGLVRKLPHLLIGKRRFGKSALGHLRTLLAAGRAKPNPTTTINPVDLQIEHRDIHLLRNVIDATLETTAHTAAPSVTLVATTHNDVPFADGRERYLKRLAQLITHLRRHAAVIRFTTLLQLPADCFAAAESADSAQLITPNEHHSSHHQPLLPQTV